MTVTIKSLADGQLADTKGTIYTVPASTEAVAKVTYVNTGASNRTVNMYVKRSGSSSRRVIPESLTLQANGGMCIRWLRGLSAADLIEGDASAATEVDYLVQGVEGT